MLRSRTMRQPGYWTTSPQVLPFSHSFPPTNKKGYLNEPETSNPRRISIRRANSYPGRSRVCWTAKLRRNVAIYLLILLTLVFTGLWFSNSIALPRTLGRLRFGVVNNSSSAHPGAPPMRELKRQNRKKLSSSRAKVGRKTLLDLADDEPEHDFLGVKHDIVNLRWPPLVTAIPEVRPSQEALKAGVTATSVDAQFCPHASRCRFLFPLWIGEQESRGRMHLMQVAHLAAALDRTLVLPNVGKSRIGGCGKWTFDAYYDVPSFARHAQELYGAPGRIMSMDDFKTWLDVRPDNPVTQMVFFDENSTTVSHGLSDATLVAAEDAVGVYVDTSSLDYEDPRLKNARCLKTKFQKLDLDARYPVSMKLASSDPPGAVVPGSELAAILQRNDILHAATHHDVQDIPSLQDVLVSDNNLPSPMGATEDADVLLLHWDLRHFPFAMLSQSQSLNYSSNTRKLADKLTKPYKPYVAVHWRMETVPPALLPDCAEALVDTLSILLADPTLAEGISSVWLATDLPWSGTSDLQPKSPVLRSNTFRNVAGEHMEAVEIVKAAFEADGPLEGWKLTGLAQEIERVRAESIADGEEFILEEEDENGLLWEDSGVWGILDKTAAMESALFVSGARGCGRVRYVAHNVNDDALLNQPAVPSQDRLLISGQRGEGETNPEM